ncbi:peptidylprolyl isomerase [Microbispora sp. ATCC PTA-5024]|uniref:peptidylprolyl isomerase n=1 Tax=Microbispora sp. ATCC PTA-5024 TaxID=316330 RepID=UPI0012EDFC3E|nr:peptidylprolyl isomerase [Microbispora sp. ATCC PTA-5024]
MTRRTAAGALPSPGVEAARSPSATWAERSSGVAAVVDGRAVPAAEVDARLATLRNGPLAARLPHPDTAEGRNLRRWVVQVMAAEILVEQEAARRGITDGGPQERGPGEAVALTLAAALRTGGVAAALLAAMPLARAVCRAVAEGEGPGEEEVRGYYRRNPDRFTTPETRWVRPFGPVRRGEITGPIEDAVFAAREGETVGPLDGPGGPWTVVVERVAPARREPYETARERIRRELAEAGRERAFARWLDGRHAEAVRLMAGFEHPADPRQPDATHHH